ncbi:AMP-binding protein [Streptomyces sp. NPDC058691]|uniref:AMP-binding protein n=1 Tax=Streptomyces sp. NPDC058691 TaxID=3346601 RepID=UPI0036517FF2
MSGARAGISGSTVSVYRLPGPALRRRAVRQPEGRPHVPYDCDFAGLDRRARAVAAGLGRLLPPGSRVLLDYPEGADLAGAFYGCLYAGMAAVPLVAGGPDGPGAVAEAVERCRPAAVLTGGDAWTALAVDRTRTQVVEADGRRMGGEPVSRLAGEWRPVGVLRTAPAYERYVADGLGGGRMEPALRHGDLADVVGELSSAAGMGTPEDSLGWIASVHGLEDAVWRMLLPVQAPRGPRPLGLV